MIKLWQLTLFLVWATGLHAGEPPVDQAFIQTHRARLEGLIEALDTEHPEMATVVGEWQQGNESHALTTLATHFKNRTFDTKLLEPPFLPENFTGQADQVLAGRFYLLGDYANVPSTPSGLIDWHYRGPLDDKEFAWMLNRHVEFPMLLQAGKNSGEARYTDKLNALWQDWITRNPYPDRLTFSAPWRSLEVARRVLNSWIHVFFSSDNKLTLETIILIASSIPEHADALYAHASFWGGNHLITEKTALLALGSAWPEFRDSAEWISHAGDSVSGEILAQSYPDGSYKELSNHYQRVILVNTLPFLRLMTAAHPDFLQAEVFRRIEHMWSFFAESVKPDGSGPLSNASDREYNAGIVQSAWKAFNRPDWLAIATHGRKGRLPTGSASRVFPWAGQVHLRNNWGRQADWIYMDAGPYGSAHQHVDRLHVSAWLNGKPILGDTGRYTYKPGPWRDYFKGPRSHSIILLDGEPAEQGARVVREPLPISFSELGNYIFCGARATFHPGAISLRGAVPWTRSILYDKRGFAILFDHLVTFSHHKATVLWQFDSELTKEQARIAIHPSGSIAFIEETHLIAQEDPTPAGFTSPDYNVKIPSVRSAYEFSIRNPATLVHVLQDPEAPAIHVSTENTEQPGTVRFTVTQSGTTLSMGEVRLFPVPKLNIYSAR
jgi:hypothetical protein